jgi:uncharacterized Tic20 family protein
MAPSRVLVGMDMSESIPPLQPAGSLGMRSSTREWEVLCHLSSIAGLLGIPFGNILGPLIIWLWKRHESLGVDAHGKESLNFHISWTLYAFIAGTVTAGLMFVIVGFLMLPFLLLGLAVGWFAMIILVIMASIKAGNGELYRYPLTIRFLN